MLLLFYLFLANYFYFNNCNALICYSCTASLDSSTNEEDQIDVRLFLNSIYQLPSVNKLCTADQSDPEFKVFSFCFYILNLKKCIKKKSEKM